MKKFFEKIIGPVGPLQRLPPGPGDDPGEVSWGYVPQDQERAKRVFWIGFGAVLALNAVIMLVILAVKVF